jgi:threonine/homoserine/homoserine lactone efflux protein
MATVDGMYAVTVFFVGGAISIWLRECSLWLSLGGAAILFGLGIKTLYSNLSGLIKRTEISSRQVFSGNKSKTFAAFFAATVANPPTALYFLALAPSVAELAGSQLVISGLVFSLGVFIGSVIWQQGLALAGVGLRKLASGSLRLWLGAFGGALIIALALSLAVKAFV